MASGKNVIPDEAIGVVDDFPAIPMPDSLQGYTEVELKEIEKRLRRKADLTIMPIIGILYILNCSFQACVWIRSWLTWIRCRPPEPRRCKVARHHGRPSYEYIPVRYSSLNSVCGISAFPDPFQLDTFQYHSTWRVYLHGNHHLGSHFRCHSRRQDLQISSGCTRLPRSSRSCFLPRRNLLAVQLVHKARAG